MASLLPDPRALSPLESGDMTSVKTAADWVGELCEVLLAHNTDIFQRAENVNDAIARDQMLAKMVDSDECLERARQLLREGFVLLQQSILRHPECY